jgi:hypothetical protein
MTYCILIINEVVDIHHLKLHHFTPSHSSSLLLLTRAPPHSSSSLLLLTPPPHSYSSLLLLTPPPHSSSSLLLLLTPPPHSSLLLLNPPQKSGSIGPYIATYSY